MSNPSFIVELPDNNSRLDNRQAQTSLSGCISRRDQSKSKHKSKKRRRHRSSSSSSSLRSASSDSHKRSRRSKRSKHSGDQEVGGSTPAEVGNILSWRLIMKYFLRLFSPFCCFKKGSCQFLAKECAQYWLTA